MLLVSRRVVKAPLMISIGKWKVGSSHKLANNDHDGIRLQNQSYDSWNLAFIAFRRTSYRLA